MSMPPRRIYPSLFSLLTQIPNSMKIIPGRISRKTCNLQGCFLYLETSQMEEIQRLDLEATTVTGEQAGLTSPFRGAQRE
jgi:hypothetical protein